MKIFNLIVLIAIALSCNDETVVIPNNDLAPAAKAIMVESSVIKKGINEKSLLKYSTEEDKQTFELNLGRIEAALLRLSKDKRDSNALTVLYQAVREIDRLQLTKMDDAVLDPFMIEVREILEGVARHQGVVLEDLQWAIFAHDFSDTVLPFGTYSTATDEWEKGWARDEGYAKIKNGGSKIKAALITPAFDLTSIRNPKFQIKHSINMNQNTGKGKPFDRNVILNGVFKAYVSSDYVDGSPVDDGLATWTKVDLAPYPLGTDFHTVYSPVIDLSDFADQQNVTIKFEFDCTDVSVYGYHYLSWNIKEFQLLGAGDAVRIVERPYELYLHQFNSFDFAPYRVLDVIEGGATWGHFGFNEGEVDLAKIESNGMATESWIVSPRIDLSLATAPLTLSISEEVRNPVWDKYQMFISTNFKGNDPSEALWIPIARQPAEDLKPGSWGSYTQRFDLSAYAGQRVTIGFKYSAGADSYNVWELRSLSILGYGDQLGYYTPGIFYSHSFDSDGLKGFDQVTLEGEAARWERYTHGSNTYARISGYGGKQTGSQLLYSNVIDLADKEKVQVSLYQAINYYSDAAAQALNLLRRVVAVVDGDEFDVTTLQWTDLEFEVHMAGDSFDAVDSGWLTLPQEFQGKKIVIGFIYKGFDDGNQSYYPNWDLYEMKLREGE